MSEVLHALHRAVLTNPSDRTVRLVYADALDESNDSTQVARAAFIRAQVEFETASGDANRLGALTEQCSELFEAYWLAWWSPVAEAAGLPRRTFKSDALATASRERSGAREFPANWPYTHTTADTTVHLAEYGLSFRFACGFPEEVRFLNLDEPEGGLALVHRWGDAMPLRRLSFASFVSAPEWDRVHGSHLARLADLSFERLLPDVAVIVAGSPHLAALTSLSVNPLGSDPGAIRSLVSLPAWPDLRTLRFTGRLAPDGVRELALGCTLKHLEELDLVLGNPGILGSPMGEVVSDLLRAFLRAVAIPGSDPPRWVEFGPPLEALAVAKWVRGLRALRIASGHASGLLGMIGERLYGGTETVTDVIPDAAVLALVSALSPDKLERLVLPAAIIGPSVREELTTRMEGKVVFT